MSEVASPNLEIALVRAGANVNANHRPNLVVLRQIAGNPRADRAGDAGDDNSLHPHTMPP